MIHQGRVTTNQRGSCQKERKTAEARPFRPRCITTRAAQVQRRKTPKALRPFDLTKRPAGVIQRAIFDQRAFRNVTLNGGGGNRTRVPKHFSKGFYVRSRSFVSRRTTLRSTGLSPSQSGCCFPPDRPGSNQEVACWLTPKPTPQAGPVERAAI